MSEVLEHAEDEEMPETASAIAVILARLEYIERRCAKLEDIDEKAATAAQKQADKMEELTATIRRWEASVSVLRGVAAFFGITSIASIIGLIGTIVAWINAAKGASLF